MRLRGMLSHHLNLGQQSRGRQLESKETASIVSSDKRPRAIQDPSPAKTTSDKKRKIRASLTSQRTISGLSFACPFYKYSPVLYGGEHGCASWCNKNIETVVRHHVLGKHRAVNKTRLETQEDHSLDDSCFEEIVKLKRVRGSGESKEKHAEEVWKAVYVLLFHSIQEPRQDVPDPYFVSRARPNSLGYTINDLESMIRHRVAEHPSFGIESEDFFQQNKRLERERSREKKRVQLEADLQEGRLLAQIRDVREKQAVREQEIDADFDERIRVARSQFMAILTGSEVQAQAYGNLSQAPMFDIEPSFGSEPPIAMQSSLSHVPGSAHDHADTQYNIVEQSRTEMLQHYDSTASATADSLQLWSSNPAFSTSQCGLCQTTISDESLWCEECSSKAELAELK